MTDGTPQPPNQPPGSQTPGTPPPHQAPPAQVPQQPFPPQQAAPPGQYAQAPGAGPGAPPGYPGMPPGHPADAVPEKKKSKVWLIVALVVGLPLLVIGGCTAALVVLAKGPIDATNDYLVLLDEQRFEEAYDAFHPDCQAQTREEFLTAIDSLDITGYSINGFESSGGRSATNGTVTLGDGEQRAARFTLLEGDDGWLVCSFEFPELTDDLDE